MTLTFMEQPALHPELVMCPYCQQAGRIGVHSQAERRFICHACRRTFTETNGTPLHNLKYPGVGRCAGVDVAGAWLPDRSHRGRILARQRTVLAWQSKAGTHAEQIQAAVVCNGGLALGQVQADELCVNTQQGKV